MFKKRELCICQISLQLLRLITKFEYKNVGVRLFILFCGGNFERLIVLYQIRNNKKGVVNKHIGKKLLIIKEHMHCGKHFPTNMIKFLFIQCGEC